MTPSTASRLAIDKLAPTVKAKQSLNSPKLQIAHNSTQHWSTSQTDISSSYILADPTY